MFDVLFEKYLDDIKTNRNQTSISKLFINEMSQDYIDKTPPHRIVCDYIAGMTDDFFNNEFG